MAWGPLHAAITGATLFISVASIYAFTSPKPPTTKERIPVKTVSFTPPPNLADTFLERWKEQIAYPTSMTREEVEVDEQPSLDEQTRQREDRRRKVKTSDICTRHNMHKVYYGRRWRCRR